MKNLILAIVFVCVASFPLMGAEMVKNSAFDQWANFKVGASAKYLSVTKTQGVKTDSYLTFELVEKTKDKVVVKLTGETVVNGQNFAIPATNTSHPAMIAKAEKSKKEVPLKKGEEILEVAGKKVPCTLVETETEQNGMTVKAAIWSNDKVPGGLVKTITKVVKPTESLIAISLLEMKVP